MSQHHEFVFRERDGEGRKDLLRDILQAVEDGLRNCPTEEEQREFDTDEMEEPLSGSLLAALHQMEQCGAEDTHRLIAKREAAEMELEGLPPVARALRAKALEQDKLEARKTLEAAARKVGLNAAQVTALVEQMAAVAKAK